MKTGARAVSPPKFGVSRWALAAVISSEADDQRARAVSPPKLKPTHRRSQTAMVHLQIYFSGNIPSGSKSQISMRVSASDKARDLKLSARAAARAGAWDVWCSNTRSQV